jgi:PAS domain-containing protein
MTVTLGLGLVVVSVVAAIAAFLIVSAMPQRHRATQSIFAEGGEDTVFIFDDDTLVDATAGARALLASIGRKGSAWARLMAFVAPRFPEAEAQLARLPDLGSITIAADGSDPLILHAEWRGGLRQITLFDAHRDGRAGALDGLAQRAQDDELRTLRTATDLAPVPMWRNGSDGGVIWANDRYMAIATEAGRCAGETAWPPPPLFELAEANGRFRVTRPGQSGALWFEEVPTTGPPDRIRIALPVDQTVRAEGALRDFIQTLALTFANLPVGLAVFDRDRRLQLFNPALADLTALRPEFLSARPTLSAVLDAMRDMRMLPEPKDYKIWRKRINAIESVAAAGPVEEVWSLPGGIAYRVSVKPHPEGALALVIEDITDALSRLRTVRADAALAQGALDAVDEAVAAFHHDGRPALVNEAYRRLWPNAAPGLVAPEAAAAWAAECAPDPAWAVIAQAMTGEPAVEPLDATVQMKCGLTLRCRVAPFAARGRIVRFAVLQGQGWAASDGAAQGAVPLRPALG